MKANTHPTYHNDARITCSSCGTSYVVGSTREEIDVEICSKCHPFYTGKSDVIVDTYSRVDKFKQRQEQASQQAENLVEKRKKQLKRRSRVQQTKADPKVTLRDMLKQTKAGK